MQLLIVAPSSDLDTHGEILDAVGAGNTKILHGNVSVREVLDAITDGPYDAIHFAGHGAAMRLDFTDGHLDAALLADAIRKNGKVQLCLFNSCESLGTALACYMAGSTYAIGWQDLVDDKVAITFAFTFWASYKMHSSIGDAYRTGKEAIIWGYPGKQTPALLNGRGQIAQDKLQSLSNEIVITKRFAWIICGLLTAVLVADLLLHLL